MFDLNFELNYILKLFTNEKIPLNSYSITVYG
jgi:hypothetical protein